VGSASAGEGVYVTNYEGGADGVLQFTIGSGGGLSADSPAATAGGDNPEAVTVTPNGRYVYVANAGETPPGSISQFSVGAGGVLSPDTPASVPDSDTPDAIAVSPNGEYVYVTNGGTDNVEQYTIGAGGVLNADTPATVAAGSDPYAIAVSPNGEYAYVANGGDGGSAAVSQYKIGPSGLLTPDSTATVAGGNHPRGIAVSPNGDYVYVTNVSGATISQYTVTASGTLAADSTPTVPDIYNPWAIVVSPNGQNVYATGVGPDPGVAQFTVGSGGMLQMDSPYVGASGDPTDIAESPDDKYVYVSDEENHVFQYSVGSGGLLSAGTTSTLGSAVGAEGIAVAPDAGPTASFTAGLGQAGATSTFTSTTTDADEPITAQTWNFGDGTTGTGATVTHVYATPGVYDVTLNVTDAAGCGNAYPFFSGEAGPFTGQLSACSPGAVTTASQTITVPGPGSPSFGAVKVKSPKVTIIVGCAGIPFQTCVGTLALTTVEHLKGRKLTAISAKQKKPKKTTRTVTLGSVTYSLNGGGEATLTITLNANAKKLLSKHHKLPARLGLIPTGASAPSATKTLTITLPRAKHKHHH
jgi:DNA-binding beta-propeller fold protein YncE